MASSAFRRSPSAFTVVTALAAIAALSLVARASVFAAPEAAAPAAAVSTDVVLLSGAYTCYLTVALPPPVPGVPPPFPWPPQPPPEDRPGEPGTWDPAGAARPAEDPPAPPAEITHFISIGGTGALSFAFPQPGLAPGAGPGFGGRGALSLQPVNLGLGVSAWLDGGTAETCGRFAESIAARARDQGCVTSQVRKRSSVLGPPTGSFSFVCEGTYSRALRAVAELNRAVVTMRLGD